MKKEKNYKVVEAAKPFYHEGSDRVVLFIHAFTESLYRVSGFAKTINENLGYTVYGIRLSGHGTHPDDLARYSARHWQEDCDSAIRGLVKRGKKEVYIVGLSFGGLLALELAAKYPNLVKKVICVDTPIHFRSQIAMKIVVGLYKPFGRHWKKRTYKKLTKEKVSELLENGIYDCFPMKSVQEVIRFMEKELSFLPQVKCDVLLIQARKSVILDASSAKKIMDKISSKKKEIFYIDNYYHSLDIPADTIFKKTLAFLEE